MKTTNDELKKELVELYALKCELDALNERYYTTRRDLIDTYGVKVGDVIDLGDVIAKLCYWTPPSVKPGRKVALRFTSKKS